MVDALFVGVHYDCLYIVALVIIVLYDMISFSYYFVSFVVVCVKFCFVIF